MKSVTIHGLDDDVYEMIRKRAKSEGRSVNKVVKELIARALGLDEKNKDNLKDFADLCGVWTEEEALEFRGAVKALSRIEPEEWQ